jgi:hypothetical protein
VRLAPPGDFGSVRRLIVANLGQTISDPACTVFVPSDSPHGHPCYGLPWGQDRLVPLYLATLAVRQQSETITFNSGAEMLDTFGMQQGESQYRRLIEAFQSVFGATIFFGTDTARSTRPAKK